MSDWSNYDSDFDPTKKLENSDLSEDENEPLVRSTVKYGNKGKTYAARPLESSSEEEMTIWLVYFSALSQISITREK